MILSKKLACGVLGVVLLTQMASTRQAHNESNVSRPLVIVHTTIIDATGTPPKPDMTIVITGNRITALEQTSKSKMPKDSQIVDGSGKFLIPGLWDMHAHSVGTPLTPEVFFPLEIANGITGVRDMFADCHSPCVNNGTVEDNTTLEEVKQWRREIAAGTLIGPRIVASSPLVDGPKPIWPGSIPVANAEDARVAVDEIKQRGDDFIKVYSLLPRDAYFALADEAKKQKMVFAGHVPISVTAAEASDAGQKSIEHLTGILYATSKDEEELRKEQLGGSPKFPRYSAQWWEQARKRNQQLLDTYSEAKASALFARFVKNGTWQCPTLSLLHSLSLLNDERLRQDPRLQYMPPGIRAGWPPVNDDRYKDMPSDYSVVAHQTFRKQLEIVGAMQRAGVQILAGSDEPNPYVYPGFSLHDELELLVQAGLTPMQALQAATINPARYLGKEKELGTIAVGKLADLVLLNADPLVDIHNIKQIDAVIVNGKLLTSDTLQKMLAGVAAIAKK